MVDPAVSPFTVFSGPHIRSNHGELLLLRLKNKTPRYWSVQIQRSPSYFIGKDRQSEEGCGNTLVILFRLEAYNSSVMKSYIFDAGDCCSLNQSFTSIGQLANSAMISSSSSIAIELKILFCMCLRSSRLVQPGLLKRINPRIDVTFHPVTG